MAHTLIIGDNLVISRAIRERLAPLGFQTADFAWTRRQALLQAADFCPDLVVVGDSIADGSPIELAKEISAARGLPVLLITSDQDAARKCRAMGANPQGPFSVTELEGALQRVEAIV